jgi:hypothetical protein
MKLDPAHWGLKVYLVTAGVLAAVNLFGPNGVLRWMLLQQEIARTEGARAVVQDDLDRVRRELDSFQKSGVVQQRMVRDALGYLKSDETSVELLENAR